MPVKQPWGEAEIDPNAFYPANVIIKRSLIGVGGSQHHEAIKKGLLPPFSHAYPGSQRKGYYGRVILRVQREQEEAAEREAAAVRARNEAPQTSVPKPTNKGIIKRRRRK